MATNQNTRDIELRIAARTSGLDEIRKLTTQIDELAKQGGDAAPEFERLSNELKKIGEQTDAVGVFDQLQQQVDETAVSLNDARTKVDALGQAFSEQKQKVQDFATVQQQAKTEIAQTEAQIRELEKQLRTTRASSDGATRATDEYKAAVQDLRQQIGDLKNRLSDQKAAFDASKDALQQQNAELKKAETAFNEASKGADSLAKTLGKQTAELENSKTALNQLGVETDSVLAAQEAVSASLAQTVVEINKQSKAYEEAAVSVRALENAQKLLDAELQIERDILQGAIATQERAAASERELAEAKRQAAAAAQAQAQALREQAAVAERALNDAFAKTGVRSAQAIQAEIAEIIRALSALRTNAQVSAADFDRAFASAQARIEKLQAELRQTPDAIAGANRGVNLLKQGFSQLAAVYGGIELAQKFFDANVQIETLRRSLALVTGSTTEAARQIKLLQTVANGAGIAVGEITNSFVKFQASLNGANIPLEVTESLFRAVVNASGQLGISSEKTSLILDALSQTASKGVVSMEELRQQLGDSLPGALDMTAKGLGITSAQLVNLVENGGLLAADFLPALRNALVQTFGEGQKQVAGLGAEFSRLKNNLTQFAQALGDGGITDLLIAGFKGVTLVLGPLVIMANSLIDTLLTGVRQLAVVVAAIVNRDFSNLGSEMNRLFEESVDRQAGLVNAYKNMIGVGEQASAAQGKVAQSTQQAGTAAAAAAVNFQTSSAAELAAAAAAQRNATAQTAAAGATNAAGAAANTNAGAWAQMTVRYTENVKAAEQAVTVSEKLAAAKKLEGEARLDIVRLSGDEAKVVMATAEAAQDEAAALDRVYQARQAEVDLLTRQRDEMVALTATLGDPGGARSKEIEKINQTIAARQAEVEKADQAAEASYNDAKAKEFAAKLYEDNSGSLDKLRAAYEAATVALAAVTAAEQNGMASRAEVAAATERAAKAEGLYRDALKDSEQAMQRKVAAAQSTLQVTSAQIDVERTLLDATLKTAQANGDSRASMEATIALKQLDIRTTQAKIDALAAEVKVTLAQIDAAEAALNANDPLIQQKREEIRLRREAIQVKQLEIEKLRAVQVAQQSEIATMEDRATTSGKVADKFVSDREREIDSIERLINASNDAADAERNRASASSSGGGGAGGFTRTAEVQSLTSLINLAKGYGLNDAQAQELASMFVDPKTNMIPAFGMSAGQRQYSTSPYDTWSVAFRRGAEQMKYGGTSLAGAGGGAGMASSPSSLPSPTGQGATNYTVTLNLNGASTRISTSSQADAQNLANFMRELESQASRSNV